MGMELQVITGKVVADISDYEKGMHRASALAVEHSNSIGHSFHGIGESAADAIGEISGLGEAMAVAGSAAMAGFLIKSALEAGHEIHKMGEETGFSTDKLQELAFAATRAGVESETMNQSLRIFNRNVGQAAEGNEKLVNTFTALGINIRDGNGQLKGSEQIFNDVSEAIEHVGGKSEQAAVMQQLFGRGALQLLPLFAEGKKGLDEAAEAAHKFGAVIGKEDVEAAAKASAEIKTLGTVLTKDLQQAILAVAPLLTRFAEALTHVIVDTVEIIKHGTVLGVVFQTLKGHAEGAAGAVNKVGEAGKHSAESAEAEAKAHAKVGMAYTAKLKLAEDAAKIIKGLEEGELKAPEAQVAALRKADAQRLADHTKVAKSIQLLEKQISENHKAENASRINNEILSIDSRLSKDFAYNDAKLRADIQQAQMEVNLANVTAEERQKAQAKLNRALATLDKDAARDRMDTLSNVAQLSHSKNAEMAAVGKAASIASTTVSTYEGATKAYASMAAIPFIGPELGIVAAAAAIAAGLANVASISGIDVGFASGLDMVPGGPGEARTLTAHGGESILTNDNTRRLSAMLDAFESGRLGGGIGGGKLELSLKGDLGKFIEAKIIELGRNRNSAAA